MPKSENISAGNAAVVVDRPVKKRFRFRPMHPVDSVISQELNNNPPVEGEEVFASPRVTTFRDAAGKEKQFNAVVTVSNDGRPSTIGGWIRTVDPDEIQALNRYVATDSGEFIKIYPVE